jgi:hypothetical protein
MCFMQKTMEELTYSHLQTPECHFTDIIIIIIIISIIIIIVMFLNYDYGYFQIRLSSLFWLSVY